MGWLDIFIFAFVAIFIFLRLRNELGNRNDEDLPQEPRFKHPSAYPTEEDAPVAETVVPNKIDTSLRDTLLQMHSISRDFTVDSFIAGSTSAYQMILEAFWAGDQQTLEQFLAPTVFAQFNGAVETRNSNGHTMENKILDITQSDLTSAELDGSKAEITMQFTTELIAVTRDKDGVAISGDLSDGIEVKDTWTFARDLKSGNPNWLLVATHAG